MRFGAVVCGWSVGWSGTGAALGGWRVGLGWLSDFDFGAAAGVFDVVVVVIVVGCRAVSRGARNAWNFVGGNGWLMMIMIEEVTRERLHRSPPPPTFRPFQHYVT